MTDHADTTAPGETRCRCPFPERHNHPTPTTPTAPDTALDLDAVAVRECHLCGAEMTNQSQHLWSEHDKRELAREVAALERERKNLISSAWHFSDQVDALTADRDAARAEIERLTIVVGNWMTRSDNRRVERDALRADRDAHAARVKELEAKLARVPRLGGSIGRHYDRLLAEAQAEAKEANATAARLRVELDRAEAK